jgi:hypothetical protein
LVSLSECVLLPLIDVGVKSCNVVAKSGVDAAHFIVVVAKSGIDSVHFVVGVAKSLIILSQLVDVLAKLVGLGLLAEVGKPELLVVPRLQSCLVRARTSSRSAWFYPSAICPALPLSLRTMRDLDSCRKGIWSCRISTGQVLTAGH